AFHKFFWHTILAILLLPAQLPSAIAQEGGTGAQSQVQAAPAEPGWLGAELLDLDDASIKALGLDQAHALLAVLPAPDGPADKAGLKPADVIVALNGQPVPSRRDFAQQLRQAGKGATLRLEIWRRNERVTLPVTLGNAKETHAAGDSEQQIAANE